MSVLTDRITELRVCVCVCSVLINTRIMYFFTANSIPKLLNMLIRMKTCFLVKLTCFIYLKLLFYLT